MNNKLKSGAVAIAILASSAFANVASAGVVTSFNGGLGSPSAGFTVVDTFATTVGLTGSNFQIQNPPANTTGAPPANSTFPGSSYLSVLGGGSATYSFVAGGVAAFQFDWGSIDNYNTLTTTGSGGTRSFIPGTGSFLQPANGNQSLPVTNGLFTIFGTAGETFNTVTFASSANSFEVDNLATGPAVPEPATWGLMLIGFGAVGGAMRRAAKKSEARFTDKVRRIALGA